MTEGGQTATEGEGVSEQELGGEGGKDEGLDFAAAGPTATIGLGGGEGAKLQTHSVIHCRPHALWEVHLCARAHPSSHTCTLASTYMLAGGWQTHHPLKSGGGAMLICFCNPLHDCFL